MENNSSIQCYFKTCSFTLHEEVSKCGVDLLVAITSLGFKITNFEPIELESTNVSLSMIHQLNSLLQDHDSSKLRKQNEPESIDTPSKSFDSGADIQHDNSQHDVSAIDVKELQDNTTGVQEDLPSVREQGNIKPFGPSPSNILQPIEVRQRILKHQVPEHDLDPEFYQSDLETNDNIEMQTKTGMSDDTLSKRIAKHEQCNEIAKDETCREFSQVPFGENNQEQISQDYVNLNAENYQDQRSQDFVVVNKEEYGNESKGNSIEVIQGANQDGDHFSNFEVQNQNMACSRKDVSAEKAANNFDKSETLDSNTELPYDSQQASGEDERSSKLSNRDVQNQDLAYTSQDVNVEIASKNEKSDCNTELLYQSEQASDGDRKSSNNSEQVDKSDTQHSVKESKTPSPSTRPPQARESGGVYSINDKISLAVGVGYATEFQVDLIITVGSTFSKLMNPFEHDAGKGLVPCGNICQLTDAFSFWRLPSSGDQVQDNKPLVCSLALGGDQENTLHFAFSNLSKALRTYTIESGRPAVREILITTSMLYPCSPMSTDLPLRKSRTSGQISLFLQNLHQFLQKESTERNSGLEEVIILGSEEYTPHVLKLLDAMASKGEIVKQCEICEEPRGTENPSGADCQQLKEEEGVACRRNDKSYMEELISNTPSELYIPSQRRSDLDRDVLTQRTAEENLDQKCVVCEQTPVRLMKQQCCKNKLCNNCRQSLSVCPFCLKCAGTIYGNQPQGDMDCFLTDDIVEGHKGCQCYTIVYTFEDGIQSKEHPHPGQGYKGTKRVAYLPASEIGVDILYLLRLAFMRGLTFTIGRSATTGRDNVIVWSGIEHKTKLSGGRECFGYPDKDYLLTVMVQLKQMGVTYESITEEERSCLAQYFSKLRNAQYVTDSGR